MATGPVIGLEFENLGESAIVVQTIVSGGVRPHFDAFAVEVDGEPFEVTGARNASGPRMETLEAGDRVRLELDLSVWPIARYGRPTAPGAVLPAGRHDVRIRYLPRRDPRWWNGELLLGGLVIDVP